MNHFLKYYFITFIFYLIEILSFINLYPVWIFDIFWLNAVLRFFLVIIFAITVRKTLFKDTINFYLKFFSLVTLSPFFASLFLKIAFLIFDDYGVIIIKVSADIASSIILYIFLKRIS